MAAHTIVIACDEVKTCLEGAQILLCMEEIFGGPCSSIGPEVTEGDQVRVDGTLQLVSHLVTPNMVQVHILVVEVEISQHSDATYFL